VDELFKSTIKNQSILDKKIEASLENWTLERVNIIDRLIMQMSICEM
jgi:N utilization substance protein B